MKNIQKSSDRQGSNRKAQADLRKARDKIPIATGNLSKE